jgi:hypothetical protein
MVYGLDLVKGFGLTDVTAKVGPECNSDSLLDANTIPG